MSLLEDLAKNYYQRIQQLTDDTIDTCRRMDLNPQQTAIALTTAVNLTLVKMVRDFEGDEEEVMLTLLEMFRKVKESSKPRAKKKAR